jgi:hypothetical protein
MKSIEKTTRQANQEKWFLRIAEYLSKDMSQDAYCQMGGLKKGTFSYWLRRHRSSVGTVEKATNGFIALQPLEPPAFEAEIIVRTGAVELILPTRHYELETLIPLIKALA